MEQRLEKLFYASRWLLAPIYLGLSLALIALGLENDELLVGAPSAAAAAKLRQLAPSITSALVARGWKVKRIRFRPQPGSRVRSGSS